jgi:RES domain-containing protein
MVYTSQHLSLAVMEVLVHVDPLNLPIDMVQVAIDVPDALCAEIDRGVLPADWQTNVAWCQASGDAWVRGGPALGLLVPSAIVPAEANLLLNPALPAMAQVQIASIEPFQFDPRITPKLTGG